MKTRFRHFRLCVLAAAALACSSSLRASNPLTNVIWGTAQAITGDSDVSTAGTLFAAYNLGESGVTDATVNGVTFTALAFPANNTANAVSLNNVTFTETIVSGKLIADNTVGIGNGTYASLSSGYQTLLGSIAGSVLPATLSLAVTGLTIGHDYSFQWWDNTSDTDANIYYAGTNITTATGSNIGTPDVTLDERVGTSDGDVGQFVTGLFTAASTTFRVNFNGSALPGINAFQLRDVTAVPETGTYALLAGAAGLALAALRRRRS